MLTLPPEVIPLFAAFAPLFTRPSCEHMKVLLVGWILAPRKRTVTAALRTMGLADDEHFTTFHRVLNRAEWSARAAAGVLLRLLVTTFAPAGPIVIGIDETLERRRGEKIAAKGIYRDPVRSSKSFFVKSSGLRWVVMMLLVNVSWAGCAWALPFFALLAPSERFDQEHHREHQTVTGWAWHMMRQVRRWLPGRTLIFVADQSYAALELLAHCLTMEQPVTMITRLRLDAALYQPAPPRQPHQKGAPRKKGDRLPTLAERLVPAAANKERRKDSPTEWNKVTIANWYGDGPRQVEIATGTCVWYHSGKPVVPIRWVLIRDPKGSFDPQALLCTDLSLTPQVILEYFIRRWRMEVTFAETRAHLGIETQRHWSDKAIPRTTPVLYALFSIITLMADRWVAQGECPVRQAAWYHKERPTFSDTIALVRSRLWSGATFQTAGAQPDMQEVPAQLFGRLLETLCYAA